MKISELKRILQNKKIDALILHGRDGVKEYNIEYFADAYPLSACKLVITARANDTFYVPLMEVAKMRGASRIPIAEMDESWAKRIRAKSIGFNGNYLSVNELASLKKLFPKALFIDLSKELLELRDVKTNEEIARIRKACALGDIIIERLRRNIGRMKTETDAKRFILEEISKEGLDPSFEPIIAAGKNAAQPHHVSNNCALKGWLIIDMGVRYKGYCSDMTRTWFIGKPTKAQKTLYQKVLNAQKQAVREVKEGSNGKDIDARIRTRLGKLAKHFIHGTGHALGREIHDPGTGVHRREKNTLEAGMVVTIEPGVYFLGKGGIRIEDTVVVGKSDCEILTKTDKKLLVI